MQAAHGIKPSFNTGTREDHIMSSAVVGPQGRGGFLGSLKDALAAASRDDTGAALAAAAKVLITPPPVPATPAKADDGAGTQLVPKSNGAAAAPSAAEAAREARGGSQPLANRHVEPEHLPTTRVVRSPAKAPSEPSRTTLVRGKQQVRRGEFEQDPVVAWLVVVGGPGIGQYRPVFEGNNTVGRSDTNRIAIDFGDDAISSDEQAYIRYDSSDRSFLFVPNLAKTNVVSLNEKRPTGAVPLQQMDVITMGRTQLVFVPFCGPEFDWAALTDK
jgi:hypothetical protein